MNELVKWLKENVGDNIQIITPQFERTKALDYHYIPKTEAEFKAIIEKAPLGILEGFGFGKWDKMNNLIRENNARPVFKKLHIPIINAEHYLTEKEELVVDVGKHDLPTKLLKPDEDVILFPGEWYNSIPDGFIVTGLNGEHYPFKKGKSDDDIRFGCLAYGIRKPVEKKNKNRGLE